MLRKVIRVVAGVFVVMQLSACGVEKESVEGQVIEESREMITTQIQEETSVKKGRTSKDLKIVFQTYNDFDYWNLYDFSNTQFPTEELYEQVITTYISKIEELYGLTDWWEYANPEADTLVFVTQVGGVDAFTMAGLDKVLSNEVQAMIRIPTEAVETGMRMDQRIAHELTHMMIDSYAVSLEEGLCNYTSTKVGSSRKANEYSGVDHRVQKKMMIQNLISQSNMTEEEVEFVQSWVGDGNAYYGTFTTREQLALFNYQYSQAFVTYLIDTYGLEVAVDFISNATDNTSYEEYFGKSLEAIREEWLISFDSIDVNIDMEYYENLMKDYEYELDLE